MLQGDFHVFTIKLYPTPAPGIETFFSNGHMKYFIHLCVLSIKLEPLWFRLSLCETVISDGLLEGPWKDSGSSRPVTFCFLIPVFYLLGQSDFVTSARGTCGMDKGGVFRHCRYLCYFFCDIVRSGSSSRYSV